MKRIKISLSLILATLIISSASAQLESSSKFYVKVYGGYGLLTPGSYRLASNSTNNLIGDGRTGTTSLSKRGLGAGLRAGGGIGVIASDFLNIGVDIEYLSGNKLKSNSVYISGTYTYKSKTEFKYTCVSITPHVIFKAVSKPNYLIYNKLGILLNLPFDLKKTEADSSYSGGIASDYNTTAAFKIGLTAGLNVALGVQVRLTDNLRGFAEVFGNYLVLSPKNYDESTITSANGGTKITNNNHITFIKNGELSYSTKQNETGGDDNTYTQSVAGTGFNMNSLGINIGITFRF